MASSQRPQHAITSSTQDNKQEDACKEKEDSPLPEAFLKNAQNSNEETSKKNRKDFEFKDDSLNKKCLSSCLRFLCDNLTIVEVVVHLQTDNILTQTDAQSIFAKGTRYEENKKLIEFVQQRGPEAFNCFIRSLTETSQNHIYTKLLEERISIDEARKLSNPKNEEEKQEKNRIRSYIKVILFAVIICLLVTIALFVIYFITSHKNDTNHGACSSSRNLSSMQSSLREVYFQSFRTIIPLSLPFFFDIEEKWVNLTLKLEDNSTVTHDYADLLKKAFAKTDILIIEGDPGMGKSSLLQRIAYEWTQMQSPLSDYDLVLYIEFRKLREYEFKDIKDLIAHLMKGYLYKEDYEIFDYFINNTKSCKEHKILVLLDGYDESALEKQCKELSDYFSSTISKPLRFSVLITSRKGYLSKLRNQGRFIFADIIGFTTESQRQEYISKHFHANNDTESSENIAALTGLINTNVNLKRLSETPLMLTFICLLHKKIIDGTEVELYMNIIWWMIDRYQKSNLNKDIPSLFGFENDTSDKFHTIENNYQYFPQLHLLGKMAMFDIFKLTFTETDLNKFQLNGIVQQVGLLRKEVKRDTSYRTNIEYSFLHRTIQEFIMALTFFFGNEEPTEHYCWYIFQSGRYVGYGIIQAKIHTFLNILFSHKININRSRKNKYSQFIKQTSAMTLPNFEKLPLNRTFETHSNDDMLHINHVNSKKIPQSQEEAIKLVQGEANQGDAFAQYVLGSIYASGIFSTQSDDEAVKWFKKSAKKGNTNAQFRLGNMYSKGRGVPQSNEEAVKWYRKSAERGNADAQFNLGLMYYNGNGGLQSYEEAIKWFRISAGQGNALAQSNLGFMYYNGKGVSQSDEEAVEWFLKSAEQGQELAQFNLGLMYDEGKGVPQSNEEAIKWYRKAAEQGNVDAQFNLGYMYYFGTGVPQSDEEAVKWLRKVAERGSALAQYILGDIYYNGKSVPQSNEEAVKWYLKSAEQGNANAQYNLGFMYFNGSGVPQSDEEAVKWLSKSAEQGNVHAQFNLAYMNRYGKGIAQSDEKAKKWYKKTAEQGYANAQFSLEFKFYNGTGVPQSDKAVKWFKKSAEQGNADAQFKLGNIYFNGNGLPHSDEEAVKWYSKSAEQGHSLAQYNLGLMYFNGTGVPQSDEEAVIWFSKSAEQGNVHAQFNLAYMYRYGKGTAQSNEKATKWYKKSAEQGDAKAQFYLGCMYDSGQGVPQSDEEAIKWYKKAAEQGYANALSNLVFMFRNGKGKPQSYGNVTIWHESEDSEESEESEDSEEADDHTYVTMLFNFRKMYDIALRMPQSDEEAVKWYTKLAEQGNLRAQFNLGVMYNDGQGVPQSDEEAVKWYRKAAEQGNAKAQFNLGVMYLMGQGVPQSNEEAVKWYRNAAEQGDALGQSSLGSMYDNGLGVPQSYVEAVKLYRKAAEQGDALGQNNLGIKYVEGQGVPQSDEEAVKLYRKAAEQDYAEGQRNLGFMYKKGRGVPQSDEEAEKWYRKAAEQENALGQNDLGDLGKWGPSAF